MGFWKALPSFYVYFACAVRALTSKIYSLSGSSRRFRPVYYFTEEVKEK